MKGRSPSAVRLFGKMPFGQACAKVLATIPADEEMPTWQFANLVQIERGIHTGGGAVVTWLNLRVHKGELIGTYGHRGGLIAVTKVHKV
jgi:hypothetical protein